MAIINLLNYKNNKVSKIIHNLYVGNKYSPNKNYDLIINCSTNLPFVINNTIQVNLKDNPNEANNMYNQLIEKNVLEEIHIALQDDKKVLIHCHMGMQRSCAVTACYLIKFLDFTVEEAINYIKSKRKIAFFFKVNFIETILKFKI